MTRIPLVTGSYTARSVIASAQRCVNLYAERNPEDSETKLCFYDAPGLTALGTAPGAAARGLYWANNDVLYYVAGSTLYSVSSAFVLTAIGNIGTSSGIVSMADNGSTLVLVDGSDAGYQLDFTSLVFSPISSTANAPPVGSGSVYAFYGATRVDAVDGFLLFNSPGTSNFYSTYNNEVVFDALYFAAKNGYSDNLVTLIVTRREVWLIGERTTEIWYDSGSTPGLPFQILPGPFVQHGCLAPQSVAQIDGTVFWLSQDQAGGNILARGEGYQAKPISTPAIQQEWDKYSMTTDAVGFCFQFGSHTMYQINFPTANRSWRWDDSTQLWHEPVYIDANGAENRHRVGCVAYAYGQNIGADWETGQLYAIDPEVYTDNGMPMYYRRGFPHLMQDGRRVIYPGFTLDIEAATSADTIDQPGPFALQTHGTAYGYDSPLTTGAGFGLLSGPAPINISPQVFLRWSDTRGRTWNSPVPQSLGATGQYLTQVKWNRTGMARDRVFEVFGVNPGRVAIMGAFLDPEPVKLAS